MVFETVFIRGYYWNDADGLVDLCIHLSYTLIYEWTKKVEVIYVVGMGLLYITFSLFFLIDGRLLFFLIYLFYLFLAASGLPLLRRGLSLVRRAGATLRCGAWASHCGGFSCCGAWAPGAWASVVVGSSLAQ